MLLVGVSGHNRSMTEQSQNVDAPVILYAEFTALPDRADEVAALLRGLTIDVREEPGNRVFTGLQKREDPSRFFVYEEYDDQAAFDAHVGAPYGAVFNRTLLELIVEDGPRLTFLTPI